MSEPTTATAVPVAAGPALVERLADEMAARWAAGDRVRAEDYLAQFPALWHSPVEALELIAEELALRNEHGLPVGAEDFAARFPAWDAQVRALVSCQQLLGPTTSQFPAAGDTVGDFRLVSELGRGAHGRVYLATQSSLDGRPVVLKFTAAAGREHLSLARLQHTHIVPLYSVHEFPEHGLRGLCLPYFGGVTLDQIRPGPAIKTGAALLSIARNAGDGSLATQVRGPAWVFLEGASYPDAVCGIGVCLADALQYAHDRGLLHLDVKPSNVLLAADGTPMLLDFHLARPPLRAGEAPPQWLGGTCGYMPPEQDAAVEAVRTGAPVVPITVDGRADVYALGVVLTELLGGTAGVRTLGSAGLADILGRCTAADPAARYPTAAALAADLRRHLSDLPLRGVGNRSLAERWRKWRRRRPALLPLLLAGMSVLAVVTALFLRADRQADGARVALARGEEQLARGRFAEATETLRGGESLLDGIAFRGDLHRRLHAARGLAERGLVAEELHAVCEQVRPLYDAKQLPIAQTRAVGERCRELWERRDQFVHALEGQSNLEAEARLRADLLDLAVLSAHFETDRQRALTTLAEAEAMFGLSAALDLERARHYRVLGQFDRVDECTRRAADHPPRTAWEHLLVGRSALAAGNLDRARAEIDRALTLAPACFWANYHHGTLRLRAGEPAEALAAFSACLALAPDRAWCVYNRGLAFTEMGRLEMARADFDRAVALDPHFGSAYLSRAAVHHRAGRFSDALIDLRRAAEEGLPAAVVEYQIAVVLLAQNEPADAIAHLRLCLAADPDHQPARDLLLCVTARGR